MNDLEKAISEWLPDIWTSNAHCPGGTKKNGEKYFRSCPHGLMAGHDIPCPPATPALGFLLLEAMRVIAIPEIINSGWAILVGQESFDGPDLLTAVIKAAALAEKEQK